VLYPALIVVTVVLLIEDLRSRWAESSADALKKAAAEPLHKRIVPTLKGVRRPIPTSDWILDPPVKPYKILDQYLS
jgi:hypothetical protein